MIGTQDSLLRFARLIYIAHLDIVGRGTVSANASGTLEDQSYSTILRYGNRCLKQGLAYALELRFNSSFPYRMM